MKRFLFLLFFAPALFAADRPNILFILADDLGYGDVGCYNPASKVPTPNLDRLAKEGLRFTDVHSPSTVCTPARYGLLTGRMPFRTGYRGVFTGVGGPCLIEEGRLTLPQMLKNQGYATAMYGKWHIGMTFFDTDGKAINQNGLKAVQRVDYARAVPDAPIHRGFNTFYGTVCCPTTDYLYAFMEGDRIPVPPTALLDRGPLPKHPYANDCRVGMTASNFDHQEVDQVFLEKSLTFLETHAKKKTDQPFFLYHSTQAVHLPSFAGAAYRGKTEAGPHGDFIFQFDDHVGQLIAGLRQHGFGDNTLVMISSDNGPEVPTVINMRRTHKHDGAQPWRGVKRDNWEGGHRVPMLAWWPGVIQAGRISDQTLCLTDVMATCAELTGAQLPSDSAEDSFSFLAELRGEQGKKPIRAYTIHQTISLGMAIRHGDWKYLDHQGSAGNNYTRGGEWGLKQYALEDTDPEAPGQLYNLAEDPGETTNLYSKFPEKVKALKGKLEALKARGRTVEER